MATIVDSEFDQGRVVEASPWPTAIRWGLISAGVGIVLQLLFYVLGWSDPSAMADNVALSIFVMLTAVAVAAIVQFLGLKAYRDGDNRGWLTLGQAVKWALYFGLIAGIVSAVWLLIYNGFIAGDAMAELQQAQLNQMEEEGASEEELEMVRSVTGATQSPIFTFLSALIGSVIISLIIGVILGLILRTSGPRERFA